MMTMSNRWLAPVLGLGFGAVMFSVAAAAGRLGLGLAMLGVMAAYSGFLVIFRRSEPVAMLAEEATDERRRLIQFKAGYFSLNAVALFVTGGFVISLLQGGDGRPWAFIGLVGAVSFVAALVFHSRRG